MSTLRRADTRFAPARADLPRRAPIEMEVACPVCDAEPFAACTSGLHFARVSAAVQAEFEARWAAVEAKYLGGAA